MQYLPRIGPVLSTLGLALLPLSSPYASAQTTERCFPETGQCISGRFREFWETNGGLAVFGMPITTAKQQLNRDTGQSYLTQSFERNRFELHPDKQAPYDVLLGRLGDDSLRQQGIDWQGLPRENGQQQGCLWFEQTGHNVCDQANGSGMKTYWERNGLKDPRLDAYRRSLALFDLPITEARLERNSSGDTVLTQWFERARLEWHPDKPEAFKVLLGLLGNEVTRIVQWRDDFNDGTLDTSKWQKPINAAMVYEHDGALNLRATGDLTRDTDAYGQVEAVESDRFIEQVMFTTMLRSSAGPARGSAGVTVNTEAGPLLRVLVGPGDSGPWLDVWSCQKDKCVNANYNDFDHSGSRSISPNTPIAIRIIQVGDRIAVYLDGALAIEDTTGRKINNLDFSIFAPRGGVFHVSVENLHVIYADK